ncbi:MAG: DUF4390 domain-containing protein [Xanthomonadales bacterium]
MRAKLFFLTFVLTAGCARPADDQYFELGQVDANWSNGQLNVTVHQKLRLSSEAREALVHGVPLTLQLELLIRHTGGRTPVKKNIYSYEIRYLPLISHYQLTQSGTIEIRTFPRLRHLLAELSTIKQSFSKADLPEGSYELMARTHLDQTKMPSPMRLPMLFSAQWRHDSDWTTWPLGNVNGS